MPAGHPGVTSVDQLRRAALGVGVSLPDPVAERLVKYLLLLRRWSGVTNLVGTRDEGDLVQYHVADSLALLGHLAGASRIVDVGSGAGFPGAVLAMTRPALEVVALEPLGKKHAFLSAVRRELELANFSPLAEREEMHRVRADFAPYDVAVSRATWAPAEWLARGVHLVRPGGCVLAMEGREQTALPAGATRHAYLLGERARAILVLPVGGPNGLLPNGIPGDAG